MRRVLLLGSVLVVAWGAFAVPMPFVETRPGGSHPVEDLVSLSATVEEVDGDLSLLTIRQTTPNILEVLWVGMHPDRTLQPASSRTPPGIDLDTYREIQADAFSSAFVTAVAVAAREAGYEVEVTTRAVVAQTLPDGPADGVLAPGDTITAVEGVRVTSAIELVQELDGRGEGAVTLTIERDEEERTVAPVLRELEELGRPGLGIVVETIAEPAELPFDATLEETNIIGPSAGMMVAVTAYDLLSDEDLAAGRRIAGTGTLDGEGNVGPIGGVVEKVQAAMDDDADLVLVPASQLDLALAAADGRIRVAGVATFADALAALRDDALT